MSISRKLVRRIITALLIAVLSVGVFATPIKSEAASTTTKTVTVQNVGTWYNVNLTSSSIKLTITNVGSNRLTYYVRAKGNTRWRAGQIKAGSSVSISKSWLESGFYSCEIFIAPTYANTTVKAKMTVNGYFY